jgi:hypothetical protein
MEVLQTEPGVRRPCPDEWLTFRGKGRQTSEVPGLACRRAHLPGPGLLTLVKGSSPFSVTAEKLAAGYSGAQAMIFWHLDLCENEVELF